MLLIIKIVYGENVYKIILNHTWSNIWNDKDKKATIGLEEKDTGYILQ